MNIYIILSILFVHWFADFVCQTEKMALNKSKSLDALFGHTGTYSLIWFFIIGMYGLLSVPFHYYVPGQLLLFVPITFVCHTATDYYTSRVNAQLWEQKKTHDFFVSIGFDQFLHFAQLIITFYLLSK